MKRKVTKPFQLWQLKREPGNAVHLFSSMGYLRRHGLTVELSRYRRVYAGEVSQSTTTEAIFSRFNRPETMPRDFMGRSCSVSDLIVMDGAVWYVDSFGFRDVTAEVGGVPE